MIRERLENGGDRSLNAALVGAKTHRADTAKIDGGDWKCQVRGLGKIALAQTLEFAVVTLRTLQVDPHMTDLGLLLADYMITTTWSSALENIGLASATGTLGSSTGPAR